MPLRKYMSKSKPSYFDAHLFAIFAITSRHEAFWYHKKEDSQEIRFDVSTKLYVD